MSSYATLRVHGFEVLSWRDGVDPTFLFLFTSSDVVRAPREPEEADDYPDDHATILVAAAGALVDRLDFLGIGPMAAEAAFQRNVEESLSIHQQLLPQFEEIQSEIDLLTGLSLSDWVNLVAHALEAPDLRTMNRHGDVRSLGRLLDIWRDDDPRHVLRALLMALDPADELRLDVSDLIDGGWMDEGFDPQATAIGHFSYAMENGTPAVIITEGSTDAEFLREAITLRYPHLESFIKFFDFGDGAEGSAATGVRTLKSFAAAGISNRVVLLLDNDSAARDALRSLKTSLPEHYDVIHYPHLDLADRYPTLGPTGLSIMNVNGLAGSVEMYLGVDVLKAVDGTLTPVQWRSYIEGVGTYQGELMHKREIQQRFRRKVKAAKDAGVIPPDQDWTGIDAIVEALRKTLAPDGPRRDGG